MYGYDWKEEQYKKVATKFRKIAKELGIDKKDFEIRRSFGGIAVPGEAIFHAFDAEKNRGLYICYYLDGSGLYFRSCTSMKDYSGGSNNWSTLLTPTSLVPQIKRSIIEWRA
jgi:hypothetical protein